MSEDHTVHHIGITVRDMDASEKFWESFLHTKSRRRYTIDSPFMAKMSGYDEPVVHGSQVDLPGGGYLELLQYEGHENEAVDPETFNIGNVHICLRVKDAAAEFARGVELGATPRSAAPLTVVDGVNAGAVTGYLRTPDGVTVELFQPPTR